MIRRCLLAFCAPGIFAMHASAQTQAHPPSQQVAQALRSQPLLLGTAWYPEQWPESRWDADLTLMEKAHMHVVRVGEFAWSSMEPAEGHFQFEWLDHAIALAAKHGIKTVLGTPTAAPPAWLTSKYPDTLLVSEDGRRAEHGNRQHFSFTSPTYLRFAARIAGEMAKHYGHNPSVIGWQIDNELAAPSFDSSARASWHAWLRARYGNVAEMNRLWATAYWSQTYDSFDEVPMHSKNENPALLLDLKRWETDTWIDYCNNQIDAMRPLLAPAQWITTNTMHWFQGFDHYKLHTVLDLAAWDDYVPDGHLDPTTNAVLHDLVRGYKRQNFWVMETQPAFVNWGAVNVALPPGVTREMAWQAIGHGADAVLYWQWRSAPNGQEEYHGTLVGADGEPVPLYPEIQQLGADFERASAALAGTSPHADVALLQDYDSHWAIDFQRHTQKFEYTQQFNDVYHALAPAADAGVSTLDIVSPTADIAGYKLVVAPALNVLPEPTARHLLDYVRNGGVLVLGTRSGMKNRDNGLQPAGQPGAPIIAALGAEVAQFYALDKPVAVSGSGVSTGEASVWAEDLKVGAPDVKVLLTYSGDNGWLKGHPAAVAHAFGKGTIVYLGAQFDVATLRSLLLPLLAQKGLKPLVAGLPAGVEAMERTGSGHRVWVVINHGTSAQTITLPAHGTDVLSDARGSTDKLTLSPHGVAVFVPEPAR